MISHALSMLLLCLHCTFGAHDLAEEYRFSTNLDTDGAYKLHWSFDLEAKTIAFAVNVSTTGWIGFGLSPNGQMPRSDVIIGWVEDGGRVEFQVCDIMCTLVFSMCGYDYFNCLITAARQTVTNTIGHDS